MNFVLIMSFIMLTFPPIVVGFILVPFYSKLGVFDSKTYYEFYRNNKSVYGQHASRAFLTAEFLIFSSALMAMSFVGGMMTGDLYTSYTRAIEPYANVTVVESEVEIQYIQ